MGWAASNGKHFPCNKGTCKADNDSGIFKQDEGNTVFDVSWKALMTVKFLVRTIQQSTKIAELEKIPMLHRGMNPGRPRSQGIRVGERIVQGLSKGKVKDHHKSGDGVGNRRQYSFRYG